LQTSTATLNPVLRDFWLTPARNRVLYGGRSSSKSWDAAGFAVFLSTQCRIRVLCARQFQNKIAESVYTLLKIQISRFGLSNQFIITENSIKHKLTGSEFMFNGLWRHIDEIKSLEGIDICWIEEAHNLTQEQWDILEPTLRKEGSQFWIIFNPRLVTDFVYRRFISNTPPDTIKKQINYVDNPFLSSTILKVIEAKRKEDEEEFRHIYLGEPLTDDDAVIGNKEYESAILQRYTLANTIKGINGTLILDAEEEYESKSAQLAGLTDILMAFMQIVSGAADIPVTRLLGQSPAGMNATGTGDMKNYHDRIQSIQELELTPAMARLDECIIRSATGARDEAIYYEWAPLEQMSEKEKADIFKTKSDAARALIGSTSGQEIITREALSDALVNTFTEDGSLPGLDGFIDEYGKLYEQEPDEAELVAAAMVQIA
jgi:hypothetical protein